MARDTLKDGALYKLLERIFPTYRSPRDGVLDVAKLADDLELTTEAVYKWLRADRIPPKRARQVEALANKDKSARAQIDWYSEFTAFFA